MGKVTVFTAGEVQVFADLDAAQATVRELSARITAELDRERPDTVMVEILAGLRENASCRVGRLLKDADMILADQGVAL